MKLTFNGDPNQILGGQVHGPLAENIEVLKNQRVALDNQIAAAERSAREKAERERSDQRAAKADKARKAFDELLAATVAERKRFAALLKETALSLGALARSAQLLGETYNLIVAATSPLNDEPRLAQLRNAARPPNDIVLDLRDHYGTTLGTGYDWTIFVPVLRTKGE